MSAASRRASLAAAKDVKMKKIAIGGGVVLLALLGFQGPKVLHQLHGSSTASADTSTLDTTSTEPPVETPPPPPATFVDQAPPQAGPGQLVSFGLFKTKDPFVQQLQESSPSSGGVNPPGYRSPTPTQTTPIVPTPTETTPPATPTTTTPTATTPTTTEPVPTNPGPTSPATTTTTPTVTTPTTTEPAPTSASLSTNGVCEVVDVKNTFPAVNPLFQLVSIAAGGQSVEIGIAGGSLESGQATVTLTKGKRVTLVNTADGVRYTLELLGACPVSTSATTTPTTTTP